jgi:hypothetical protein
MSLVIQRSQRITDAYIRLTGCCITSSHPLDGWTQQLVVSFEKDQQMLKEVVDFY